VLYVFDKSGTVLVWSKIQWETQFLECFEHILYMIFSPHICLCTSVWYTTDNTSTCVDVYPCMGHIYDMYPILVCMCAHIDLHAWLTFPYWHMCMCVCMCISVYYIFPYWYVCTSNTDIEEKHWFDGKIITSETCINKHRQHVFRYHYFHTE
jgi:hypothetical protein